MMKFFLAYRRLNLFLLIFSVCPFLQCEQTQRFVCRRKYFVFVCATTSTYFIYVLYLSSFPLPHSVESVIDMVHVLKFCRTMGNAYAIFFVVILLTIERRAHANFFNRLYQFDRIYNKLVEPSMKYTAINRMFWIESIAFTAYACFIFFLQVNSNERLSNWHNILFWGCEIGEQCVYAFAVFHMKNCACNLTLRLRKMNRLLVKLATNNDNGEFLSTGYWQLEQVAHMLDILLKARDNLQNAFGSALILMFTYNLFAVALSSYIVINANFYENSPKDQHVQYNLAKYFGFELPLILKDFYCTSYYHFLGNTVRCFDLH